MNINIIGLILSYALIGLAFLVSQILINKKIVSSLTARKIVHIIVANWWIIAMTTFDNVWFAIVPPLSFIFLNWYNQKIRIVKALDNEERSDLGTIYYPIALLILTFLSWGVELFRIEPIGIFGAVGVLIMGYGDGLATIIGSKVESNKLFKNKTIAGSLTMLIVSFIISLITLSFAGNSNFVVYAFIISFVATVVELITPFNLDNITVPLIASFTFYFLTLIS